MASTPFLTASRIVSSTVALSCCISPFVFDLNHTHVYNPNWPPHARFHNGQTMSMGVAMGLMTLYFSWRRVLFLSAFTKTMIRDDLFNAALMSSMYFVAGLSAAFYPGAKFLDPEFLNTDWEIVMFGRPAQITIFVIHGGLAWIAYALGVAGLRSLKSA